MTSKNHGVVGRSQPSSIRKRSSSNLDVSDSVAAPTSQAPAGLLQILESLDQHLSGFLHRTELGLLDFIAFIPAFIFSAYFIPVVLFVTFFVLPAQLWTTSLLGCLFTLLSTLVLKKAIGRIRPGAHTLAKKRFDLRSLEKNHALPSGDSAQAALFAVTYALAFREPRFLLFIPATMLGRVYFGCHWIGDTVAGAVLGTSIAYVMTRMMTGLCSHDSLALFASICSRKPAMFAE